MTAVLRRAGSWLYRLSDRAVGLFLLVGLLVSPFFQAHDIRAELSTPAGAGLAVLLLALGLAWYSLLRRGFVWLDPARLTWDDTTDARIGVLGRRLWAGWLVRFAAVGYVAVLMAVLFGGAGPAEAALFGAVALLAVVVGRRRPGRWGTLVEYTVAAGLVVLAGVAALVAVPPVVLLVLAGAAVLASVAAWSRRPAVAVLAGRDELVAGYLRRLVRRVTVSVGDVLSLLPVPGPLRWPGVFAGRGVAFRFVAAGVLARRSALLPSALLVFVVAVLHHVAPVINPVFLVGVGVYLACVPFAAGLAQLSAVPGLRRWLGSTDIRLRLATAAVLAVVAAVWLGLVAVFAVPVTVSGCLAAVVAVGAVVRTVTRPALDFGNMGIAVTPSGYLVPVGLLVQLGHGPELLVVGIVLVGFLLSAAVAAPVAALLAGYGIAR